MLELPASLSRRMSSHLIVFRSVTILPSREHIQHPALDLLGMGLRHLLGAVFRTPNYRAEAALTYSVLCVRTRPARMIMLNVDLGVILIPRCKLGVNVRLDRSQHSLNKAGDSSNSGFAVCREMISRGTARYFCCEETYLVQSRAP